jgi:putative acyl-CoA dehydrogenase
MVRFAPRTRLATHEVVNQPPDFVGYDLFAEDGALAEAVAREGGPDLAAALSLLGREVGSEQARAWAVQANRFPPELRSFDHRGRRVDEVEFHPAYHALMDCAHRHRIAAVGWDGAPGSHVAHAARLAVFSEVEQGTMCPLSMTYASVAVLRSMGEIGAPWVTRIRDSIYEPELRPLETKRGATVGMAMTEKQGGSDLRANTTRAEPDGAGGYRLFGHKWFCSAPMSDGFLSLAQAPEGLSCFLVPRITPDGERNSIQLMRLKDKLGNRSNASAEIEYHGAHAILLGQPGRGIATIMAMVHHTRLDTMASTLGIMRAALAEAANHTSHRAAFGRVLIDQPLMRAVLADLQLDYEAAAALTCRVARAVGSDPSGERALGRIGVALGKYRLTKRVAGFVAEALECLGGAGYVEENPLPRLYREAPVNAIWEGSGNVIALDVLRTLTKDREAGAALRDELATAVGQDARFDSRLQALHPVLAGESVPESGARVVVEQLAGLWCTALLVRHAPGSIGRVFLDRYEAGHGYGALTDTDTQTRLLGRIGAFADR